MQLRFFRGGTVSTKPEDASRPKHPAGLRGRLQKWKEDAAKLKVEVFALYLASRDPRTPWYAKALLALVIGYAISPIDLIPDFIPILGYVDDLILIPAGVSAVRKMIPPEVLDECRARARSGTVFTTRQKWIGAALIVGVWLLVLYLFLKFVLRILP